MKSFKAQILYRIECEGQRTDQYGEQWRLVYAEDENKAVTEARTAGANEEATFIDRQGRTICWKMLAVKDLQPVDLKQGGLLFSQLSEVSPGPTPIYY